MSVGPIDIEFVLKGDVDKKLKDTSDTVKGESSAMEKQLARLTKAASESFGALSGDAQAQAVALQRITASLNENAAAMDKVKAMYQEGSISAAQYAESMAMLTTEQETLRAQAGNISNQISDEIRNNQLVSGSISELRQRISELKESYDNLSASERAEFGKQMQAQISDLTDELNKAETQNKGFLESVTSLPGPIGAAATSIDGMTRAALKFIATPIGAVLAVITAALMALSSWFKRTEEGQNALAVASGYFKQTLDSLLDVVDSVGKWLYEAFTKPKQALVDLVDFLKGQVIYRFEAIGKMGVAIGKIFSGDWKEGFDELSNAMAQFSFGIENAGQKMANWANSTVDKVKERASIENQLFQLKVRERQINEEVAATQARIAELREKAYDVTVPEQERLKYIREASKLIDENYAKEIELATKRRDLVKRTKELSNSNMQDNEEVSALNVEILNLQTRQSQEQRALLRQTNMLTNAVGQAAITGVDRIKQDLEKLNKDILDANDEQRKEIALRILELEKELQVRLELANAAILAARNEKVPEAMKPAETDAADIFKEVKKEIKGGTIEMDKLNKKVEDNKKKVKEMMNEWDTEKFQKFLQNSSQILDIAGRLTSEYAEQLGLNEDQAKVLDKGMQAMSGIVDIASGNYLQGAFKIIDSVMSMILKIPAEMNVHFEHLQERVEIVINSIDLAINSLANLNNTDVTRAMAIVQSQLKNLAKDAADLNNALQNVNYGPRRPDSTSVYRALTEQAFSLRSEIEELIDKLLRGNLSDAQRKSIEAVLSAYDALLDQIDTITQEITGTTARSLADSLAQGFLEGIEAAELWGKSVDDIIKHIMTRQLSAKLIMGPVQEAVDKLIKDTEDGLTADEAKNFRDNMKAISDTVQPAFEEARKALQAIGIDLGGASDSASGLTGITRAITEETGSLLAGQIMGMRVDLKSIINTVNAQRDHMDRSLMYLAEIAVNTRHNSKLNNIDDKLGEMNRIMRDRL